MIMLNVSEPIPFGTAYAKLHLPAADGINYGLEWQIFCGKEITQKHGMAFLEGETLNRARSFFVTQDTSFVVGLFSDSALAQANALEKLLTDIRQYNAHSAAPIRSHGSRPALLLEQSGGRGIKVFLHSRLPLTARLESFTHTKEINCTERRFFGLSAPDPRYLPQPQPVTPAYQGSKQPALPSNTPTP